MNQSKFSVASIEAIFMHFSSIYNFRTIDIILSHISLEEILHNDQSISKYFKAHIFITEI